MMRGLWLAAMLAAVSPASGQLPLAMPRPAERAKEIYLYAGTLYARPGQPPRGNVTIIIRDGKIATVRDGFVRPIGDIEVVDLRNRVVLPGLIDLHVHLWGIGGDPLLDRLTALNRDVGDDMIYAVANARKTLAAGFTTVRDLGGDARGMRALREGVDRGDIDGPTIVNAGDIISVTGGHADAANGVGADFAEAIHARQGNICDSADSCRQAVRRQVALGAEVIKFAATGGVLSNVNGGLGRAMTVEEMGAIVESAHALGRKAAAHSHAAEGTKTALRAGADTIEHGSFLDDEAIRLFKEKGAWLIPTMLAGETVLEQAQAGVLPAASVPKAREAVAMGRTSHRRAIAAGVKIAFGTDTGVSRHGDNGREFALMVAAGMAPAQALRAATLSAAEALGRDGSIGSIEPGKDADIVAVATDPIADIRTMEHVVFVMRHGIVERRDPGR